MSVPVVLRFCFLIPSTLAVQMCTDLNHFKGVEQSKILPDSQIINITMPGIMTCSRACLSKHRCKSFNFNMETGECQLNSRTINSNLQLVSSNDFVFSDISHWPERLLGICAHHTCPLNAYCDPVNTSHHVCVTTGCLGSPAVENGHFTDVGDESLSGTELLLVCDRGFVPESKTICQNNGTWSSSSCVSVSSCSMMKQYQPDSEDGEYWLRLINFYNYTARLYCHDLATSTPAEFLTLPNFNYGIYPRVSNYWCSGESGLLWGCVGEGGDIKFSKIRVNITRMSVSMNDTTFANISNNGKRLGYGIAYDCYTTHANNDFKCGTRGKFIIDLRGTSWKVSENQQWEAFDYKPMIESIDRQMNGTLITLRCGGFSGGCRCNKE